MKRSFFHLPLQSGTSLNKCSRLSLSCNYNTIVQCPRTLNTHQLFLLLPQFSYARYKRKPAVQPFGKIRQNSMNHPYTSIATHIFQPFPTCIICRFMSHDKLIIIFRIWRIAFCMKGRATSAARNVHNWM